MAEDTPPPPPRNDLFQITTAMREAAATRLFDRMQEEMRTIRAEREATPPHQRGRFAAQFGQQAANRIARYEQTFGMTPLRDDASPGTIEHYFRGIVDQARRVLHEIEQTPFMAWDPGRDDQPWTGRPDRLAVFDRPMEFATFTHQTVMGAFDEAPPKPPATTARSAWENKD